MVRNRFTVQTAPVGAYKRSNLQHNMKYIDNALIHIDLDNDGSLAK